MYKTVFDNPIPGNLHASPEKHGKAGGEHLPTAGKLPQGEYRQRTGTAQHANRTASDTGTDLVEERHWASGGRLQRIMGKTDSAKRREWP